MGWGESRGGPKTDYYYKAQFSLFTSNLTVQWITYCNFYLYSCSFNMFDGVWQIPQDLEQRSDTLSFAVRIRCFLGIF